MAGNSPPHFAPLFSSFVRAPWVDVGSQFMIATAWSGLTREWFRLNNIIEIMFTSTMFDDCVNPAAAAKIYYARARDVLKELKQGMLTFNHLVTGFLNTRDLIGNL